MVENLSKKVESKEKAEHLKRSLEDPDLNIPPKKTVSTKNVDSNVSDKKQDNLRLKAYFAEKIGERGEYAYFALKFSLLA